MKKVLSFVSSAVLALAVAFSASAAQIVPAPKHKAQDRENAVRKVTPKAAPEKTLKKPLIEAKIRTASTFGGQSHFRKAATRKSVPVKVPFKTGARVEADTPDLLGSVIYSKSDRQKGLYSIPMAAGQDFELKVLGPNAGYGGVLADGVYYTCDVLKMWGEIMGINYRGYDLETGEEVYNKEHQYYTVSMTSDPTTGKIYAISVVEDMYALTELSFDDYEVDFNPYAVLEPENLGAWNSIACAPDGQLYGIYGNYELDYGYYVCTGATLYKIDKTSGELTKIGDNSYDCSYMSDSTFDPKSGKLFWTIVPEEGLPVLAEVNTATGAVTPLMEYEDEDQITGLAVQAPAAEAGAPAAAEDLEAKFENGSLSGTVSFTVPATTFDGEPATGNVTYTVKANGEEIATGTAACGEAVSLPVTLPDAGSYNIAVTLTNAAGNSPAASVTTYAGKDTPAAPEVTASYDSAAATVTISWTAVTGTVNGGYMDADAVTYTVTRYPGATVVAEDITATTATDDVTDINGKIYYAVEASADGLTSKAGQSNSILLMAAIVPPYMETFDNDEALEPFTIINANGDTNYSGEPNTWHIYDNHARVSYNSSMAMDDWLISPAIKLEAGKTYDVVADLWANGMTYPERVEVKMGTSATVEGLTTVLLEPTIIGTTYTDPYKFTAPVSVDADGEYYIGFHGISDADMYALHLDNFGVTAPIAGTAPGAVENFTVTADEAGALSVTISFTAPTKAIDGSALAALDKIVLSRGEDEVKTWDNPAPGAELSYTDAVEEGGDYTYSVQAFNADGEGLVKEASAFVGFTLPAAPTGVTMVETANPGEVTLAWNAVTADLNGITLPASEVTYQVYKQDGYSRVAVSEKISGTSFTFQAVEAGTQDFVQFMVYAYDYAGESAVAYSPFKPVGTPYTTFSLTSEEDFNTYIIGVNETEGGEWYANSYKAISGLKGDADGTGLLLYMVAYYIGDAATVSSGKIDLSATENPGMVFYTYPFGENDTNVISAYVTDTATGETTQVYTSTVAETGEALTWNRINIDLSAYAGKTVQLSIYACTNEYGYVLVDGWKVESLHDYDLAVTDLTAPAIVPAGSDFDLAVTVANNGTKDAGSFTVALFADGEKLEEKTVDALASCKNAIVNFSPSMDALASEPVEFYATVTSP
ncbi:MAG: choice-of-anchor J domain-containing protein, partial [Muribaculaceae bacterium]|nr:choice-of-anchor J domain-containing protein [Muribaculaceae bacterium]